MSEHLFLEMKNYSFLFEDDRFDIDLVPKEDEHKLYELYFDKEHLYILVPFEQGQEDVLKIFYPTKKYNTLLQYIQTDILWQLARLSIIALLISLLFSFYALNPLRKSLLLLEEFIKDIIHDLNTPLTAILINLKMMDAKSTEVQSISQSAKTISMLHKNLDSYLKNMKFENEKFSLKDVVKEQVTFFSSIYDYLTWEIEVDDIVITSDKNAFSRVIYNLLSNACKYNTTNGFIKIKTQNRILGFIKIKTQNRILSISNSSYGIKNPSKIFDRFYKESDRGLGIGLHIVEKLCTELGIKKKLEVKDKIVTVFLEIK